MEKPTNDLQASIAQQLACEEKILEAFSELKEELGLALTVGNGVLATMVAGHEAQTTSDAPNGPAEVILMPPQAEKEPRRVLPGEVLRLQGLRARLAHLTDEEALLDAAIQTRFDSTGMLIEQQGLLESVTSQCNTKLLDGLHGFLTHLNMLYRRDSIDALTNAADVAAGPTAQKTMQRMIEGIEAGLTETRILLIKATRPAALPAPKSDMAEVKLW